MRILVLTRIYVAMLALGAVLAASPAPALIELPSIKNRLIQLALDQISSPGSFEVTVEAIDEAEEGGTSLLGVKVSDNEGVWLTAERLTFAWRPTRLAAGELAITKLELVGLDVMRLPSPDAEAPELEPQEPWSEGPFDWPRAPIDLVIEGVRIERAHIAEGVLARSLRFDASGHATDKDDLQEVVLEVTRADEVEGRIDFLMRRMFGDENTLRIDLSAREAPGGLVAAYAGLPADSPARLELHADGTAESWRLDFDAAAEDFVTAAGNATLDYTERLSVKADFFVRPGPEMGEKLRTVLGEEARLVAEIVERSDGMIEVVSGELSSPALELTASGALATGATGESDLAVSLVAQPALADLAEGVAFERFGFDGTVTGPSGSLAGAGEFSLRGLETAAVDVRSLSLEGQVAQTPDGARFDLTGASEGLRLDRVGPETIGPARLEAEGALAGDLLTLERAAVDSEALTASASGRYDLAAATGSLALELSAPRIAPVAAAYGVEAEGAVSGSADVELAGERIEADLSAALDDFAMAGVTVAQMGLDGTVTREGERIGADFSASVERIASEFAEAARLDLEGTVTREDERIGADFSASVERIASEFAEAARLDLEGTVTQEGERIGADFSASVERFASEFAEAARLGLEGTVTREGERLAFDLDGSGERLRLDQVPPELTREARLTARGALEGGSLELGELSLDSALLAAGVSGTVGIEAGRLAIDYRLETPDLAPVAQAYDVEAAGALSASGRAEGAFEAPRLVGEATLRDAAFAGKAWGTVRLEHDVTASATPEGEATVTVAGSWLGDAEAAGGFRLEGEALSLSGLEGRIFGAALAGSAEVDLGGPLVDGTFDVSAPDLGPLGRFAGIEISGGVDGQVRLAASEGAQGVEARLDARRLAVAGVEAASGQVTISAADVLGTPRLDLSLAAADVAAAGAGLETVTARMRGPLAALEFSAEATGMLETRTQTGRLEAEPFEASLAGRADAAGTPMRVTLARAEIAAGDETVRLERPLELRIGGGTVAAEGLALSLPNDGRLAGDAALRPGGYTGDLTIERLDLSLLGRWTAQPITSGSMDARAVFDTRPGSAGATVSAGLSRVVFEGAEAAGRSLEADLQADWDGARNEAELEVRGDFGEPLRARFSVPLRPRSRALPEIPPGGELQGSLAWSGRIGDLWALVPAPGHILDGDADIDLTLGGTIEAPRLTGVAEVTGGQYQNLSLGTILTRVTIETRLLEDGNLEITFAARDGASGTVEARMLVVLGEGPLALDLTASADDAVLVRRDDVTAAASGEVAVEGPLNDLGVTGEIRVDRAEVRLVNAMPPSVVTLDGIRIAGEPEIERDDTGDSVISLDLSIGAGRNIFVRGRGLDSEWRMDLAITGTAVQPVVTGTVERIRGRLGLLGRPFELERGRVVFDGGSVIDPRLDIYLQHEDHGIRGGIVIEGTASDPELNFTSVPALPEEEVMPRLLFGQSRQSLTGGQALQLATGIAALTGTGGGGPIEVLREAAGLDVLRVEGESVEEAAVTAGRNVGENIFIGAKQGLGEQGTSITVEVEVFDNVTVDTEVGQRGNSSVGISLKKDF